MTDAQHSIQSAGLAQPSDYLAWRRSTAYVLGHYLETGEKVHRSKHRSSHQGISLPAHERWPSSLVRNAQMETMERWSTDMAKKYVRLKVKGVCGTTR